MIGSDKGIKKLLLLITLMAVCFVYTPQNSYAYMVKYKEDFYKLFHVHYQQYPDDVIENIWWLEKAVQADFANPLYAQAKIKNEKDWEKYRYLFMMHLNLKLIEQHLRLGRIYDKKNANFYDAPFKDIYLKNLEKAKTCYTAGLQYWREACLWAEKANVNEFSFLFLTDIQEWEDERERIRSGKLNYEKIISRELTRINKVTEDFIAMDSKNY